MSRIDIRVSQDDIDNLKLTSTQAVLKGEIVEYRSSLGRITINTLLDADGHTYNRRDLSQWSTEKLFSVPVIAALCAAIKDARELVVNLDNYYFKVEIVPSCTPELKVSENPLDKAHLLATMELLKGSDSYYRPSAAGPKKLSDLDVAGMIHNGGVNDVLVKVSIGSLVTYVPFTSVAASLPVGSGAAYVHALGAFVGTLLARAFTIRQL